MLSSTAWTSLRVMVAFSKSSWVTPENLLCKKFAAVTKQFQVVFRFLLLSRCQVDEERLTACCSQRPSSQVWQKCRRWLSSLSRWPSLWSALGPVLCSTVTKTDDLFSHCLHFYSQNLIWIEFKMNFDIIKQKENLWIIMYFIIINERNKYAGCTNIQKESIRIRATLELCITSSVFYSIQIDTASVCEPGLHSRKQKWMWVKKPLPWTEIPPWIQMCVHGPKIIKIDLQ